MKLALGTGAFAAAVLGAGATPLQPVRPAQSLAQYVETLDERSGSRLPRSLCRSTAGGSKSTVHCFDLLKREDVPQTSATIAMSPMGSAADPNAMTTPFTTQPTSSSRTASSMIKSQYGVEASSNSNESENSSADHLRTVGIVGGFLAGIALIAVICTVILLTRSQRVRSSMASGSTRSRSRTHSYAQPPPFLARDTSDSTFPITRPPPLRIYTGHRLPTTPRTMNTTGGHNTELLQFPVLSDPGSVSSRTASPDPYSESDGNDAPRRPAHLPSLGLSHSRPFLRSVVSALSYHASAGHSPIVHEMDSVTHGTTVSMTGSRTLAHTHTHTDDTTRSMPAEAGNTKPLS